MRILIAESKTMTDCAAKVSSRDLRQHMPCFDSIATAMMDQWRMADNQHIASALKISAQMVADFKRMAYEFPNKTTGQTAIEAFTGIVFKALDYTSLPVGAKDMAARSVNIISSLYGWLRSDDIIKPYRLDYPARMAPPSGTESMARFWKERVTQALIDSLTSDGETEILNLMPADACKCIDWAKVSQVADVVKADFRSVQPGGSLKTPHSTLLKTLRGKLLRHILLNDLRTLSSLMAFTSDDMYVDPDSAPSQGLITILA